MEGITLVRSVGLAVLIFYVHLQVGEIACLLQFLQFFLGGFKAVELLCRSNVVGKLQFLLLCVENGNPLVLRAVRFVDFDEWSVTCSTLVLE